MSLVSPSIQPDSERNLRRLTFERLAAALSGSERSRTWGRLAIAESMGYDRFGMEKESLQLALALYRRLHRSYFQVRSNGSGNLPQTGPYILAANHAGPIPVGVAMLLFDVLEHSGHQRLPRPIANQGIGSAPFLNVWLSRTGTVYGCDENIGQLLETQKSPIIYLPEGPGALMKPLAKRNHLLSFQTGVVEASLKYRVPVVPVGIVGIESQAPVMSTFTIRGGGRTHTFPLTPTFPFLGPLGLVPPPAPIQISYGEPLHFSAEEGDARTSLDRVRIYTDRLQSEVQKLVDGLRHG